MIRDGCRMIWFGWLPWKPSEMLPNDCDSNRLCWRGPIHCLLVNVPFKVWIWRPIFNALHLVDSYLIVLLRERLTFERKTITSDVWSIALRSSTFVTELCLAARKRISIEKAYKLIYGHWLPGRCETLRYSFSFVGWTSWSKAPDKTLKSIPNCAVSKCWNTLGL